MDTWAMPIAARSIMQAYLSGFIINPPKLPNVAAIGKSKINRQAARDTKKSRYKGPAAGRGRSV
ncbi:MAG: hypothetical protein KF865_08585 [Bdellovibrionaceae bacterium]|nr:hypothetical protein [Pseudobdellovibrionaceae bacterium]